MSESDADAAADTEGPRRRRRRAVRPGVEQPSDDVRAWEDDDRSWGEHPHGEDDRLRREVPPHWG